MIIEQALKHKIKNKDRLLYCQANGNMHQETPEEKVAGLNWRKIVEIQQNFIVF